MHRTNFAAGVDVNKRSINALASIRRSFDYAQINGNLLFFGLVANRLQVAPLNANSLVYTFRMKYFVKGRIKSSLLRILDPKRISGHASLAECNESAAVSSSFGSPLANLLKSRFAIKPNGRHLRQADCQFVAGYFHAVFSFPIPANSTKKDACLTVRLRFFEDDSMLNRIAVSLPEDLKLEVQSVIDEWKASNKVSRIWKKDASVWTDEDEAKWLGWLNIVDDELKVVQQYRDFRAEIEAAGFKDVLLMGMGGSSLCPEVLGLTFGKQNFHILDSTVPARIKAIEDQVDIGKTLFIVASKSGSTLEPNCFKQYFFDKVSSLNGKEQAGKQFVAITDPGSKMEKIAKDDGFRYIFYGKPEIGGRFSALSAFGLTAAAAMGLDVEELLQPAKEMAESCKDSAGAENTGLLLGAVLGVCQKRGRDKLTIFTGDEVNDLGAWLEQLLAESTGKNGVAIIPVDREPVVKFEDYSDDRIFVCLISKNGRVSAEKAELLQSIKHSSHPFIDIELDSIENIGQEFFRWEFATAVAGSIMGINPFNQPDVESAKVEARKLTDEYEKTGSLPSEKAFFEGDDIKLFTREEYAAEISKAGGDSLSSLLKAHLSKIKQGDYFALLAYLEMSQANEDLLQSIRAKVLEKHKVATCLGFGPRFLHSTGQAYKGGPNSGVFLQITSDDWFDLPVPGQKYTFGIVKAAQARGDFQVLLDRGRRALRVHLGPDVAAGLKKLESLI